MVPRPERNPAGTKASAGSNANSAMLFNYGLPTTLNEAADFHRLCLQRLNRSTETLRLYAIYQHSFLAFLLEHEQTAVLEALNPQCVRAWQAWLLSKSTGRRGGIVSEKQGVLVLKTWARFLWDNDVYAADPLARLKVPRVRKIHRKPFSENEARRLVQAAAGGSNPVRDRAILLLLLDTGCRIGELCAAEILDVDMAEGTIAFRHTKGGRPRRVIFRVPTRRDGGPALSALRTWLKVREARPGVLALFTTRERLALSTRRAREIFTELGEAARVPDAMPHRARHTAASEYMSQRPGAELQLRSRLGQVSDAVLSDYVTWSDKSQEEAAAVASLSYRWNL
jgi:integrase/recombinase XerC